MKLGIDWAAPPKDYSGGPSSADYEGLPAGAHVDGELQMPSFGQSGLKVVMADGLNISGDQKVLLVDFDVAQSFGHVAGQSGAWVMHPVITGADLSVSGSIRASLVLGDGVTLPGTATLGEFEAVLTNGAGSAEAAALTDGDGDGTFETEFLYLLPGEYTVSFNGPALLMLASDTRNVPSGVPSVRQSRDV